MIDKAITMCRLFIGEQTTITDHDIDSAINNIISMPVYAEVDKTKLKAALLEMYRVRIDSFKILEAKERREPWIKSFKSKHPITHWQFWGRYKDYLSNNKGFAPDIISNLDALTDQILDKLYDPTQQDVIIGKKGLVVGQVQSGKTANYTGLICKAADSGFNLIIVLAGIHNNLRSQTQLRLDEGFLGFDTQFERAYTLNQTTKRGVGLIPGYENAIASSITTSADKGDFTKRAAETLGVNFNTPQPILVVVKKNATVLKRLHKWLLSHTTTDVDGTKKIVNKSLLVIDDEADNASINTKKENESPTAINAGIRNILSLFSRSGYIGYTATPFANIFIPLSEDDLFPRDFIINLPAPSNYIGPDKIFGTSALVDDDDDNILPIVRSINDYNDYIPDGHKRDADKPSDIPESLKTAIKSFIITCAVRIARGQETKHNSMLVHVTRFVAWQNHVKELVDSQFQFYRRGIEQNIPSVIEEIREAYEIDTPDYISYKTTTQNIIESPLKDMDSDIKVHKWDEIKELLYRASTKIEVKAINGTSLDALKYYENDKSGLSVIAVGGDKLSRGLTLEGLSVSYYLRASKMYDTLMQMGRWFGYRPGYVDLCRLYTSCELNEWFRHITLASEELREEFNYLAESGSTPEDYALKVRTHPGCLQITAVSKMRNVNTIRISWSGKLIETYQLSLDRGAIHSNKVHTDNFISSLGNPERKGDLKVNYLWRNVNSDSICNYLSSFKVAENLKGFDAEGIIRFIYKLNQSGELINWSVALMNKKSNKSKLSLSNGLEAGCFIRNRSDNSPKDSYLIRKNHIVGNQTDEFIDLSQGVLDKAHIRSKQVDAKWTKEYPKPKIVREEGFRDKTNPLLIIYPLDPDGANLPNDEVKFSNTDEPFIGLAISFPSSQTGHSEEYAINGLLIDKFRESEEDFDVYNDNAENDE
ncbi:Endonuclease [Mucinivorans hirudinis]|uniref:Endonuclease n=1 Tax=Mucinivorans hirudinis TaxID=1433126 RepID=A0A060R8U6_9BACT|nr:Endonuclease [Mucinivorans hirudinis]